MAAEFPSLPDQECCWQTWQANNSITAWSLRRAERLLEWLRSLGLQDPEILDLGCGTGWFTERLAQFGHVTGVDLNRKGIEEARARIEQATFFAGNFFELALPRDHYDILVAQQVIAHVVDQPRFVELAASLLKPRGFLVLTTPNKFVMDRLGNVGWASSGPHHIEQWLDRKSLFRLVRTRFEIVRCTSIVPIGHSGVLRLVNSAKLDQMLGHLLSPRRLQTFKERAGFGYTLLLLARKRSLGSA
jgi:2-polyprenyl-3-methyl-5-hydroxy-6-metoxy-1,4-benzoquinol methylase